MIEMKTATFKKMLTGFNGVAGLYELSEPLKPYAIDEIDTEYSYVVVSAMIAWGGPTTYIFGADESGNVLDWLELPGSIRGIYCHKTALENAGYEEM